MELEIAAALVTVFTLAVTVISARSYLRTQSVKVLIITTAFAMFFVKGVVISLALLQEEVDWEALTMASLLLDSIVAILLFTALVARKGKKKGTDMGPPIGMETGTDMAMDMDTDKGIEKGMDKG